ncbi:hypothetical protein N656DRAFT_460353 [Canariomyces notabilis]|uniref:Uncharacterized protein n=1 Tax=Canariomyces notabilis TaxID=2074819 RepID=A0AAN6QFJ3_9PEZI|nr:hypothetical protein N656DRAFT_460353 [Canariomyces arenarius]
MVTIPSDSKLPYESLKRLVFSCWETDTTLDRVAPILKLASNLKILHCHSYTQTSDLFSAYLGRETPAAPPPLWHLTELVLVDSHMAASSLRNLLNAVGPNLSKVRIRRCADPHTVFSPDEVVKVGDVVTVLRPWSHVLRELRFSVFCENGDEYAVVLSTTLRNVSSLRDFSALEVLVTRAEYFGFYGREVRDEEDALVSSLPPSLRYLRLYANANSLNFLPSALWDLSEASKRGQFKHLDPIEIGYVGVDELADEPGSEAEIFYDLNGVWWGLDSWTFSVNRYSFWEDWHYSIFM